MYCKLDRTGLIDTGNSITVIADLWEGIYEDIIQPNNSVVNQFVRKNRVAVLTYGFEKSPVSEEEINEKLNLLMLFSKGDRIVIP